MASLIFLTLSLVDGLAVALIVVAAVMLLVIQSVILNPASINGLVVLTGVLGIPIAGCIAGTCIDTFLAERRYRGLRAFEILGMLLSLLYLFESTYLFDVLSFGKQWSGNAGTVSNLLVATSIVTKIVWCGVASALACAVTCILFELPALWFSQLLGTRIRSIVPAVKMLLIAALIAWCASSLSSFFVRTLSPSQIFAADGAN